MKKINSLVRKSKPITFKTATFIVLGLHGLAFVGLTQWSSFKASISKSEWMKRKEQLISKPTSTEWPSSNAVTKVVTPSPKRLPQERLVEKPIKREDVINNGIKNIVKQGERMISEATKTISENVVSASPQKTLISKDKPRLTVPIKVDRQIAQKVADLSKSISTSKQIQPNNSNRVVSKKPSNAPSSPKVVYSKQTTKTYNKDVPGSYEITEIVVDSRTIGSYVQGTMANGVRLIPVY